ncbi:MAG: hypothetical protein II877_11345, partial [Synergistaceae bacterium]|nr:hypothetical protein [Synergistaceae bacterium]
VQYVKGSSLLGNLGTLAKVGGMFIPGAGWLTPLGYGMSAADGLINGYSTPGFQNKNNGGLLGTLSASNPDFLTQGGK